MSQNQVTDVRTKDPELQKVIPIHRVPFTDHAQLPNDYSATPGGTLFSTTPGGTRIIYDRNFLMQCRNSPLAQTPPTNLPDIPGVTRPLKGSQPNGEEACIDSRITVSEKSIEDSQFHMDI